MFLRWYGTHDAPVFVPEVDSRLWRVFRGRFWGLYTGARPWGLHNKVQTCSGLDKHVAVSHCVRTSTTNNLLWLVPWYKLFVGPSRFHSLHVTKVIDAPVLQFVRVPKIVIFLVATQRLIPMVSLTMEIPQLPVDTVIDVPVVQVGRIPQMPSWRRQLCSHSCTC